MNRIPVAVLGATGTVGQKFVTLLKDHPQFEIAELVASPRSAGKTYREACAWKQDKPMSETVAGMTVTSTEASLRSRILFSGLDSSVAGEVEEQYAGAGHVVISNSRNHRMDRSVPLIIPEINADHFALIEHQPYSGAIITNSNCSTMFLAMALAPLVRRWGVEWVQVTTMQAISGAGYPGVASLDILGNIVPYIAGEEEKMAIEAQKILGSLVGDHIEPAPFIVSAACNRVPVFDGHTEALTVRLGGGVRPAIEEIESALAEWRGMPQERRLHSAPDAPIVVAAEPDHPQPARDLLLNGGMSTVVGRIRHDTIGSIKMVIMGHNTIRGAAGAAILNAEAFHALGYYDRFA
ncbi:MAG: aspartate-semialdehyde dehydrogenase [Spirochaetales bacterium]|nr:aspartate-semialdehyde dehydrogenase [Spirochaetales bacterium]